MKLIVAFVSFQLESEKKYNICCCDFFSFFLLFSCFSDNWKYVMLFLFANAVACVLFSILLNIVDWKRVCFHYLITIFMILFFPSAHGLQCGAIA